MLFVTTSVLPNITAPVMLSVLLEVTAFVNAIVASEFKLSSDAFAANTDDVACVIDILIKGMY